MSKSSVEQRHRTTRWRNRTRNQGSCMCQYHLEALGDSAPAYSCTCIYHKKPGPCCRFHNCNESSGNSSYSSSYSSSECITLSDINDSLSEEHATGHDEQDFMAETETESADPSGCVQDLLATSPAEDMSDVSSDSLCGCETVRVFLRPLRGEQGPLDDDSASHSDEESDEVDEEADEESNAGSYRNSSTSESEDEGGPHPNLRDQGLGHDDNHHNGEGRGLGHGGDPDDPDDDTDDGSDDNDDESSDSDPDGDMPDDIHTFSLDDPTLDNVLQMLNGLTRREAIAMVLALSVRSNLDYETTIKIFSIMAVTLGQHQLPVTKKLLWRSLRRNWFGVKKRAYCSECYEYLGIVPTLPAVVECRSCHTVTRRGLLKYFITFNVRNQLITFLKDPDAWDNLQYVRRREKFHPHAIEDILDGEGYRRLPLGEFDFTYQFNLDPFSTSKSSKTEVCPIFLKLNELPINLRQKNVILAGLWIDQKYVLFNLFLKTFRKQANKLSQQGIRWRPDGQERISKFYPTCCVADAVGRAGILNISTHAGHFSCPYCEHPGVRLDGAMKFPIPGSVVERVRRVRGMEIIEQVAIPEVIVRRTDASIRRAMLLQDRRVTGVIGPSEVALILHFSLGIGFSTDDLHPVFVGVAQFHTELLLDGIPGVFQVTKNQKKIMSNRLKGIKTPTHISRKPRGIDTVAKWKATEWRNWLLYYANPCWKGIIPDRYPRHFGLLSEAIFLLSRDIIMEGHLLEADQLITEYVNLFQEYFGAGNMRYNIHILTHIVQCVRYWGPLWAHSTFPFESWNHRLGKSVSSPKGAIDQIAMRYLMVALVRSIPGNEDISHEVKRHIDFIMKGKPREMLEVNNAYFFGQSVQSHPTPEEAQLLAAEGYICENFSVYPQVLVKNMEVRSTTYRDDIKSLISLIYSREDEFCQVQRIIFFRHEENPVGGLFTRNYVVNHLQPLHGVAHIVPILNLDNEFSFVPITNVRNLAIKMTINEIEYISVMPNQVEID